MPKEIVIYQGNNGKIAFKGDFKQETLWASQAQLAALFNVDQSVVSRHVKNIFKDRELPGKSNMQKMHIAGSDRPVVFYSLDVILAVGYRTNSRVAIEFRKWATKVLRQHLLRGYTIDRRRITENFTEFSRAVESIKKLLPAKSRLKTAAVLELVKLFADTWMSLSAYDNAVLPLSGQTKKQIKITAEELVGAIA